jgi:NADP-reducing hydrogenase subunit HndD
MSSACAAALHAATASMLDVSSPSIVRDPDQVHPLRQVRPGLRGGPGRRRDRLHRPRQPVRIVGTAFDEGLNVSSCINCGQCIMVCPTGALREQSHIKEVIDALDDPEKFVVVQHAPACRSRWPRSSA